MSELADRERYQQQLQSRLERLSAAHRKELESLLGTPPDLRNVPDAFWEKVERETQLELAAILILIMMACSSSDGLSGDASRGQADRWSHGRAREVAAGMRATTVNQLNATAKVWNAEIAAGKKIGVQRIRADLMKVLGPERMRAVVITETTKAASAGTMAAADGLESEERHDVVWRLGNAEHCPFCVRMANTSQAYWSKYTDGPPAHVGCQCFLQIVSR